MFGTVDVISLSFQKVSHPFRPQQRKVEMVAFKSIVSYLLEINQKKDLSFDGISKVL